MYKLVFAIRSLLISLFFSVSLYAASGAEIAVYTDNGLGAWEDGIKAFENFLDWKGISHERVTAADVNTLNLSDYYQAIYFPGGYAYYYKIEIDSAGLQHIRDLVAGGGGYIGICAGAYFACDSIDWEEDGLLDYPLDLYDGVARGAIDAIAPWDNYTMTTIGMYANNPINQYEPAQEVMLYYGGSVFKPHQGFSTDTLTVWADYYDSLAAVNFSYGEGRVVLMGMHPEIEEDSNRDSTTFADELDDQGSDWPFLWSVIDWLLKRPITYPSPSALQQKAHPKDWHLDAVFYPNPFNNTITIKITTSNGQSVRLSIFNSAGRKVFSTLQKPSSSGSFNYRWSGINNAGLSLPTGVYFLQIEQNGLSTVKKITLIK